MQTIPFAEALSVWWRIGWLSFGGPAGQIALMHRITVDEKGWLKEDRFLHALYYCMLLPGPWWSRSRYAVHPARRGRDPADDRRFRHCPPAEDGAHDDRLPAALGADPRRPACIFGL